MRLWSQCMFRSFPFLRHRIFSQLTKNMSPVLLQYLGSMLIKDLRGTESTQDACAKMRVCVVIMWRFGYIHFYFLPFIWKQICYFKPNMDRENSFCFNQDVIALYTIQISGMSTSVFSSSAPEHNKRHNPQMDVNLNSLSLCALSSARGQLNKWEKSPWSFSPSPTRVWSSSMQPIRRVAHVLLGSLRT